MIFDRVLAATRHDDDVGDAGLDRFLDAILNDRLVDEHEHLLRLCLGRGKKSRSKTCSGKYRLANHASHGADRIAARVLAFTSSCSWARHGCCTMCTRTPVIDPALFRDNLDAVRTALANRGVDMTRELEELAALEARRRRLLPELEGQDTSKIQEANRQRAAQIKQLGVELDLLEQRRNQGLLVIPNIPHSSVPIGKSGDDNKEVRRVGIPRTFSFAPQPHWDLGPALGIIDFERGTKIAGARFTVLMGAGARLARALINFML